MKIFKMNESLQQHLAFERLKKNFAEGTIKSKHYGQTEPVLRDAIPYDVPGNLKDWSQDRKKCRLAKRN